VETSRIFTRAGTGTKAKLPDFVLGDPFPSAGDECVWVRECVRISIYCIAELETMFNELKRDIRTHTNEIKDNHAASFEMQSSLSRSLNFNDRVDC
jgi:hypothetical protein